METEATEQNRKETTTQSETRHSTQITLTQSQIAFTELVIEKEIGEGSYGKVYLGKWNHAPVALKFCRKKGKLDEFMHEVKLMT
jgi:predicted Ser/Thr protein kinase